MKVGLVYTSTTPELIRDVEREVRKQLGDPVELFSQEDPSILAEVREHGYVTTKPAARLVKMFLTAAEEGCDAILNICSSVGEVADAVQPMASYLGVPVVRIDEEMCREAVRRGKRIGVMATLPTTMAPTMRTIERVAREIQREVDVKGVLVEGAFGVDQEAFLEKMSACAETIVGDVDVIVLAQGSMAYAEDSLTRQYGKPFLGSPGFGAKALRAALTDKGCMRDE